MNRLSSVAVVLLMRFYLEAAILFMVMLLVSSYAFAENISRNLARNDCRAQLLVEYAALTAENSTNACGFGGMAMIEAAAPDIPFYLLAGLGTCQEYSNESATSTFFARASGGGSQI